jgi:predicted ArsR family transcriptional regulator
VLRSATAPVGVPDLAAALGLHATTVRFHLEVLEQAGLVRRSSDRVRRPGRPPQLYEAVVAPVVEEPNQWLAEVLVTELASDAVTGAERAEQAGMRWAEQQLPVDAAASWEQATGQVEALFQRMGFAPTVSDDERQRHLELRACPFREVARAHPRIVCSIHLGLLREALRRSGVPRADEAQLRPFVEPELCVADLTRP